MMFVTRRSIPSVTRALSRSFHATAPASVKVGDSIPDIPLHHNSPGTHVSLAKEFSKRKKGLIIGVPAAFSPSCSETHIPGYINYEGLKDAGDVFVVSVNDAFVMKAWGEVLDPKGASGIRFLADPSSAFTKAMELDFTNTDVFGGPRSVRYALVIENGKVKEVHVEKDKTGVDASAVDKVLGGSHLQ